MRGGKGSYEVLICEMRYVGALLDLHSVADSESEELGRRGIGLLSRML